MSLKRRALAVLAILSAAVSARGAVVFTENFEGGGGAWTNSAGVTPVFAQSPAPPPEDASSTLGFEQAGTTISRIGRLFSTAAGVTSVKLTFEMYTSNTSTSTQRYYGQLSNGTAGVPGAGTGGFFRVGANNNANYQALYSNGATQTLTSTTVESVGWHKVQLTIIPGAAGVGSFIYQIDNAAPVTTVSSGAVILPTNVQLGQSAANGSIAAVNAFFDSIKVEQFAPAASKATTPAPVDTHTGDDPNATVLGWVPGANNLSTQDLLFGTDPTLTAGGDTIMTGATAATNSFNPGALLPNTTYYWEVVSKNGLGDPTTGDIWSFTTAAAGTPEPVSLSVIGLVAGGLIARRRRRMA